MTGPIVHKCASGDKSMQIGHISPKRFVEGDISASLTVDRSG
jgi:hypothetical protein